MELFRKWAVSLEENDSDGKGPKYSVVDGSAPFCAMQSTIHRARKEKKKVSPGIRARRSNVGTV